MRIAIVDIVCQLEGRQVEWVTAILDAENAHQEAVHAKHSGSPNDDCYLLAFRILDAGDLQRERDGRKGQDTICHQLVRGGQLPYWNEITYTSRRQSASPCRIGSGNHQRSS